MINNKKGFKNAIRTSIQASSQPESTLQPDGQLNEEIPVKPGLLDKPVKSELLDEPTKMDKPVKITLTIKATYAEMIKREAFWERETENKIINEIFKRHCESINYDPIPDEKRPTKRGPKPKS